MQTGNAMTDELLKHLNKLAEQRGISVDLLKRGMEKENMINEPAWLTEMDAKASTYTNAPKGKDKVKPTLATIPVPKAPETDGDAVVTDNLGNSVVSVFLSDVDAKVRQAIEDRISKTFGQFRASFDSEIDTLEEYLAALKSDIFEHKNVTITTSDGKTRDVPGRMHESFPALLRALQTSFPPMLVGPAGSGKTFAAEKAAEALELPFYSISVGSQSSKTDLIGYMTADGNYIRTQFRDAYENGGLFLCDEIDAGNPSVLIILNSALSGSQCPFPDKMVPKHKDFRFVGTANTFGNGASRQYVGRNQLDAATLDRFLTLTWNIDEKLERVLVENYKKGPDWHKVVIAVRKFADARNLRMVVSPRATLKGAQLFEQNFTFKDVLNMTILADAPQAEKTMIEQTASAAWH